MHSVYVLTKSVTFGRAGATDIQILDQRVSRQHARLMVRTDGVVLIDLSSSNGTYVGGARIHRRTLRSGDRIQIGFAEYAYEEAHGELETSPRFLGKLTTPATSTNTIVQKVAKEILGSPTAEMPEAELASALAPSPRTYVGDRPTREAPTATTAAGHTPLSRAPTRDAVPHAKATPEPRRVARTHGQIPFAPRDPSLLSDAELAGFATEPLDPRRHGAPEAAPPRPRRQTLDDIPAIESAPLEPPPRRPTPAEPAAEPHEHEEEPGTAQHAVDAVLKLLALRDKEARGARLRVQEREGIRRLEAALRSPRGSGNRRRWARLPCKLTARLGDGATASAVVADIGAGGISIESSDLPIAPGDEVTIRVVLGEDRVSRTAVFHTRVVWVDAMEGTFGAVFAGPASWEMTA